MVVAAKTGKAKYTYAERVLGAFSDIQRQHRKHAVHIASLRTQVAKNAVQKNDHLGPQWKRWVKRAITNLEDQGVMMAATPRGAVTLTPEAKRAIGRERYLHSPENPSNLPTDDHVWRRVTHDFSAQGLKRKTRHTSILAYEDSDMDEEVLGTLRGSKVSGGSARKARKTKKPLSRMTKTELYAEVRMLQDTLQRLQETLVTELRDHNGPETEALSGQLRAREEEIHSLNEELDKIKSALEDERSKDTSNNSDRLLTSMSIIAPRAVQIDSSSPIRPDKLTRKQALFGMSRTASGSLISHLSKQPTPAPSDRHSPAPTDMDSNGDFDAQIEVDNDTAPELAISADIMPILDSSNEDVFGPIGVLIQEPRDVAQILRLPENVSNQNERDGLHVRLEPLLSEIRRLEALNSLQADEKLRLEGLITSREEHITTLQAETTVQSARLIDLEHQVLQVKPQISSAEEAFAKRETTLMNDLSSAKDVNEKLTAQLDYQTRTLDDTRRALKAAEVNLETYSSTNAELLKTIDSISLERDTLHKQFEFQQERIAFFERAEGNNRQVEQKLQANLKESSLKIAVSEHALDTSRSAETDLRVALAKSNSSAEVLQDQLNEQAQIVVQLQDEKMSLDASISQLHHSLVDMQDANDNLRADVDARQLQIDMLKNNLQTLAQELAQEHAQKGGITTELEFSKQRVVRVERELHSCKQNIDHLEKELDAVRESEAGLHRALEAAMTEQGEVVAEMEQHNVQFESDRSDYITQIETLQDAMKSRLVELDSEKLLLVDVQEKLARSEADLKNAVEEVREIAMEANELKSAREDDVEVIERLKRSYEKLRKMQMEGLREMDEEISLSQVSPIRVNKARRLAVFSQVDSDIRDSRVSMLI